MRICGDEGQIVKESRGETSRREVGPQRAWQAAMDVVLTEQTRQTRNRA